MGTRGPNTFENDGALDWLHDFRENPSEALILATLSVHPIRVQPRILGRLLGRKAKLLPGELDGEAVLAAVEVVASISGRPAEPHPEELEDLPLIRLGTATVTKALEAARQVVTDSNLLRSWSEADDFETWRAGRRSLREARRSGRAGRAAGGPGQRRGPIAVRVSR